MNDAKAIIGSRLRGLPSVQRLLESDHARALTAAHSRERVVAAIRAVLERAREDVRSDGLQPIGGAELLSQAGGLLAAGKRSGLRRVINATGIALHTNLGRAPLAEEAIDAVANVARGYSNLEYHLDSGERGSRTQSLEPLLCQLTGAEAALAVNNAAAAVLLALSALAGGGEVIVSRGELVEIGGGFRVPEVVAQGGARLVEVGATNKTRLDDYRGAITPATRVLLKVHPSNYRIIGFTAEASLEELAALARERGLVLMHDLGSGALIELSRLGRPHEPTVREAIQAGADLVAFSGDKLLGGPQAGILVGRRAAIDPLRRHPLLRAVRLDKMSLAALESTLRLYREDGQRRVPLLRILAQGLEELEARAERIRKALDDVDIDVRVEPSEAFAGGGALPQAAVPSRAVTLKAAALSAEALARGLRTGTPPVISRIAGGRVVLDMLTIADGDVSELAQAVRSVADR